MPIDTKIEGNPDSLRSTANWLRQNLSTTLHGANDKVYAARNSAAGGLRGEAADALRTKLTTGAGQVDDFAARISGTSQQVDAAADFMQQAQADMQRIRSQAAGAGLTVTGEVIHDPGPTPAEPGPPPTGAAATPEAVDQHGAAVQAQQDHAGKAAAFHKAKTEAEGVHRRWGQQVDQRAREWHNLKNKAIFTVSGFGITGGAEAAKAKHKSILSQHSDELKSQAARSEAHARAMGGTDPQGAYRNLDDAAAKRMEAGRASEGMDKAGKAATRVSNVGGGVLAAGGVVYDIAHGKPAAQAVTSGAAGFGASVATGAAVGSFGGPVGTALGTVGGAAVGAFTSGAVDSVFKNGIGHVGTAIEDGGKTVVDTGKAVGSLAADAGKGIASGVKDVWNSIF